MLVCSFLFLPQFHNIFLNNKNAWIKMTYAIKIGKISDTGIQYEI